MLTSPASILPGAFLTVATIGCLAIGGGTIHAPAWVRDISYPCAIAFGWHAIIADIYYIVDHAARAKMMMDILDLQAKPEPRTDKQDYIIIGNSGVETSALREIAKNAQGAELQPERQYRQNQLSIRNAHNVLIEEQIFEPARGNRGPRIKNAREWELIVSRL